MIREYIADKFNLIKAEEAEELKTRVMRYEAVIDNLNANIKATKAASADAIMVRNQYRDALVEYSRAYDGLADMVEACVEKKKYALLREWVNDEKPLLTTTTEAEPDEWDFEIDIEGEQQ